ncbi:MAG: D-alanyl-D-alanine carboxypeptidase [Candidatus Niyogibacteria bacterium]|nr:D-alanyl-D-alanine carboxypeptidase [Candidatus Niyogibacteria bacterium]
MTFDIRPRTVIAALFALSLLAPFNAKFSGTFSNFTKTGDFFSLIASAPYASLAGSAEEPAAGSSKPAFGAFDEIRLEAKSAVVWDAGSDRAIFAWNAAESRALASLTKLATAVVGERLAESVGVSERVVRLTPEAIQEEGDDGFTIGERFYFSDIRDAMLVKSSNDAARAIAEWAEPLLQGAGSAGPAFINEMNRVAAEIGLRNTYFLNATGLDLTPERAGAVGSAEDFARLVAWIIKQSPHILFATQASSVDIVSQDGDRHHFVASAKPALAIPGLVGAKTGFTDLAGGNLVLAVSAFGRSYVIVVLGSTREGRFSDAMALWQASVDFSGAAPHNTAL